MNRSAPKSQPPHRQRPRLEPLEAREVPTITNIPVAVAATEGVATPIVVAQFTDSDSVGSNNFTTVQIHWGDGTTTTGTVNGPPVVAAGSTFTVTGSHAYAEEGSKTVTVSFHDTLKNTNVNLPGNTAAIADAPLSPGNPVSPGVPQTFQGVGGTITSGAVKNELSAFEAAIGGANNAANPPQSSGFRTINWDAVKLDGTDFGGNTVVIDPNKTVGIPLNRFQDRGVFFEEVYAVSTDAQTGGSFADVNPGVNGLFPSFSPHNTFAMFNENTIDFKFVTPSNVNSALVDAASRGFGAIFRNVTLPNTTSIEFFNGDTSLGKFFAPTSATAADAEFLGVLFAQPIVTRVTITLGTDAIFDFDGTTFSAAGTDNPAGGHNLVVTDDFAYAEPTAIPNVKPVAFDATAGKAFSGVVGTFTDADQFGTAKDYTTTINWGDGSSSPGTVTQNAQGGFDVSGTHTYDKAGTFPVSVQVQDFGFSQVTLSATANVAAPPAPPSSNTPPPGTTQTSNPTTQLGSVLGVGADVGGASAILFKADGSVLQNVAPFGTGFAGGVRTATGDVNHDGTEDLIAGTGPGSATLVKVLDGNTQATLFSTQPFEATFTGGVFVASGDVNGDGFADIVVTPDEGGGPRVRVFSGKDGSVIADFLGIDDPNFRGGARAALADINGDGTPDLLVAAGFGGGPRIAVFDGKSLASGAPQKLVGDFFVFEQTLRNGVFIAGGDVNGDGFADVVAGGGPGGGPRVFALSGKDLLGGNQVQVANFFGGDPNSRGGIRVSAKNLDGDNRADLVVGAGQGAGSRVTEYAGKNIAADGTPPELNAFDAFPGFGGGVFVG